MTDADQVWVVRRIFPTTLNHAGGKFYWCNAHSWHANLSLANRFLSREEAVKAIAESLSEMPEWWGTIHPVRLIKKAQNP